LKDSVVVIGAGGHAKVCVEILHAMGRHVAFCVGQEKSPACCAGVPVVEGDKHLLRLYDEGYVEVFVAIGSNGLRQKLAAMALSFGYSLVSAVSPKACVSPSATLGRGIAIMAGACINAEAIIGDLAIINTGSTVDHDCVIGTAVHIAPQSGLAGNVKVGDRTFVGIGSCVIPEITIGSDVTLGAGSVVVRNLPAGVKALGVPVRIVT
jgi:UDP-perosamine 4-acetyltransferase